LSRRGGDSPVDDALFSRRALKLASRDASFAAGGTRLLFDGVFFPLIDHTSSIDGVSLHAR